VPQLVNNLLIQAAYQFNITPDQNAPGGHKIQAGTNKIAFYALLAAGLGAVLSLMMIAVAKGLHLERLSNRGKEGFVVAIGAVFIIGIVGQLLTAALG
jgi:hypothetical protein